MDEDAFDVVVLGAGAAGLTAACTAAALGRRVCVLERTDRIGGTTAISGGMVWIPCNGKMAAAGLPDSPQAARDYLRATVPGFDGDARMAAFLEHGDRAIRFLEARTSLRLRPVRRYPDYYPDCPGATTGGRVLEPEPFDARALGPDFALLRDPLPEFMLFGGMMVSREDLPVLRRAGTSAGAMWHAAKLVARYARQRLRAHRGTSLVLGNALAARLFKSARDLDVRIVLDASVQRLVEEGGRVVGVTCSAGGAVREVRAALGVILATGGISHYTDLRSEYVPADAGDLSATVRADAACGGVQLGRNLGARSSAPVTGVDAALAFWVPASSFRRKDGSTALFPHTVTDRAKPGLIAVNRDGRRFVNEAVSYHEFVKAQLRDAARNLPAWLVCDRRFLWKYGLGCIRPFALSTRALRDIGYLKRADSLEELARLMAVPPADFVATVQRYNDAAAHGDDPEFGRGSNAYQRHLGDADHAPNPCVAPIVEAPFHAIAVRPADLGMAAGLVTDPHGRVERPDGRVIDGLYACGNDMHSVMNGAYPGPGITLGPALVFGWLAALDACGVAPEATGDSGVR